MDPNVVGFSVLKRDRKGKNMGTLRQKTREDRWRDRNIVPVGQGQPASGRKPGTVSLRALWPPSLPTP